jgi:hypothetical protein
MGRNNADFHGALETPHAGLVPISTLEKYKEFDREGKDSIDDPGYLDELTDDIKQNGVQEPLHITHENGRGVLTEGNHRLVAAKRLGMTHLPVVVWNRGHADPSKGARLTWSGPEDKTGYVPASAHPSNYKELQ